MPTTAPLRILALIIATLAITLAMFSGHHYLWLFHDQINQGTFPWKPAYALLGCTLLICAAAALAEKSIHAPQ